MENFKGNSNASKQKDISASSKKIEPIVSAENVKVKKETELKRIGKSLFSEDATTVGEHVINEVLVPKTQNLIVDALKYVIDFIFFGKRGSSTKSSVSNVSYTSYYKQTPSYQQTPISSIKNNIYRVNDVIFNDRGEAEEVLLRLNEEIERYGMVSIADFYDLISQTHSYTDNKYGWRDLKDALVVRSHDGYSIKFPKIVPLE